MENDEYDYGHNVLRYHIDGEGDLDFEEVADMARKEDMKRKIENITGHSEVSEKAIERYLCDRVKSMGGICLKFHSANMVGFPDRVVLLPKDVTIWIELKSRGEKPTKIQQIRHNAMRMIGHRVFVADSKKAVDEILGGTGI